MKRLTRWILSKLLFTFVALPTLLVAAFCAYDFYTNLYIGEHTIALECALEAIGWTILATITLHACNKLEQANTKTQQTVSPNTKRNIRRGIRGIMG